MKGIRIYTDGGCSGNPGPGAWAYIILADRRPLQASGFAPQTTNNRMELQAVIEALRAAGRNPDWRSAAIEIFTDSQYMQKGISEWIHTWVRNGWRTRSKKPVKNQDLWQELVVLARPLDIHWRWLRGHAGDRFNERCDRLVQEAIKKANQ